MTSPIESEPRGANSGESRSTNDGFTLIEIVLVAVVLAILLAASVPRFQQTSHRLRAEQLAFEFAQLLRYVHGRAVAQGDVIVVTWDGDRRRATLGSVKGEEPAAWPTECTASPTPLSPALESTAVPTTITVSLVRHDRAVECVNFFPDGTSEATTLHLVHRGSDYTIAIDASTSRVFLSTRAAAR
jgi:type II secretion system protein H